MLVIDGVVGVGKSTLMEILAKEKGLLAYEEPVVNNPILDKFYYNRERYSFPLQIFFLNERFRHIKQASLQPNAVLDRSIYGDLIFAKMLKDNGEMSVEEFNIYLDLFHNMIEHCKVPKLMVYLEISPEEAMKRIVKRGRDFEQVVEKEYWIKLNENYRQYFAQYSFSPVLTINVDSLDFENKNEDRKYVLTRIDEKLRQIRTQKEFHKS
ncbi:deoxynucleoside kinase (plasmid) [Aneurinibacillus sp. Ricciae_BoGa-3]|uniref:deoxynucleoside kinase n=1 Tax=Aneurinibacillus sp. Ricciae_BoGa-3 TaxID=3022697 RepID=UPI002340372A|nr:deoxynucleoside kinase [Aneurinibacillus sp. Ricciae_BoGa-3]WCK57295.1 deoxynucleoside kinase [Aneurinibacillus sp. Ricciae_BoGa-3]